MRLSGIAVWLALAGFGIVPGGPRIVAGTAQAATTSATGAKPDKLATDLKAALTDAVSKIAALEPWQKVVFDEEVLTSHERFIRDYRQSASGVSAEVEIEALKRYLSFHAQRVVNNSGLNKFALYVAAEAGCEKCFSSADSVTKFLKARFERRGFQPLVMSDEDVGKSLSGKALYDRVLAVAAEKNASGAAVASLAAVKIDADDPHADERRFEISLFAFVKDLGKTDVKLEIAEADSFLSSASRLLTDVVTDFGGRVDIARFKRSDEIEEGILVEVNGIRDFAHYTKVKGAIERSFAGLSPPVFVERRKLTKGAATFAIFGASSAEEIKGRLSGFVVTAVEDRLIRAETK